MAVLSRSEGPSSCTIPRPFFHRRLRVLAATHRQDYNTLAPAVAGLTSQDVQIVRPDNLAMESATLGWHGPIGFRVAANRARLVTDHAWGLFRRYWVLFKLLADPFGTPSC